MFQYVVGTLLDTVQNIIMVLGHGPYLVTDAEKRANMYQQLINDDNE